MNPYSLQIKLINQILIIQLTILLNQDFQFLYYYLISRFCPWLMFIYQTTNQLIIYLLMNIRKIDETQYKSQQLQNLLDLVLPSATADTNIHTFSEFKEWINGQFHIKTQLNTASYIKKSDQLTRSIKVKQAKSLGSDKIIESHFLSTIKRKTSQLGLIEEKEGMEGSYNTQYHQKSRKGSIGGDLGFDLVENSIIGSKSAHSSRSFNGYQQINQFQLRERLGKGSFAEVYLAYDTTSEKNEKYAVKVLQSKQIKKKFLLRKNSQMIDNEQKPEVDDEQGNGPRPKQSLASLFVRNQVAILKKMNHQYITKLYDVIVDNENSKVYLVLDYCSGGFINESKSEKGSFRKLLQSECKRYFKQICLAMDYIHNIARIAHRDIKPQNILLNEFDEVKISDFGLGTHKLKGKSQSGTPLYMSPESLSSEGQSSSQACDIWALGVTLLVMLSGKHPEFIDQRINLEREIALLKEVSENCKDFIRHCLQVDVEKRHTPSQLLEHAWLGVNQTQIRGPPDLLHIEISPADELNFFKNIQKKPKVNVFQLSLQ